jgi:rubrerythrin
MYTGAMLLHPLRRCPRCGGETEDDNLNWWCKVCGAWLS